MFSESLIVGLIVLLLCGAACFYMYVRMTFLEKKFLVIESILVDVRVAMDSLMMEHMTQPPAPIATTPGVGMPPPVPQNSSEMEAIPEESFYSSILEQAHDAAEVVQEEGQTADAVLESFESSTEQKEAVPAVTKQNLESMTRSELAALAESKGIRVKRSMGKGEVISLLRRVDPEQNQGLSTGAENVSGSAGSAQQLGSSLDGVTPMDMEQGERLD
jgi:hypothetical protein